MRTFIAINLPKNIKDYLFDLQKHIKSAKVKWVAKKNLHLTLKFLGEIDEKKLEETKACLNKVKFKPFKTYLSKLGVFPKSGPAKVIWVNTKPDNEIRALQQAIDSCLIQLYPEDTRFESHITLGRIKFIKDKQAFINTLNTQVKPLEFTINTFELMQSILKKEGPEYHILSKFPSE